MITFAEAKEIVRAAEEADWTDGTYMIEAAGWEDDNPLSGCAWCRRGDG